MNRPPCCWIIGWYAERPCRSWEPLSTISLASGALPGTVCAMLCAPLHSSSKLEKAQYNMTLLNQCVIVQTPRTLPLLFDKIRHALSDHNGRGIGIGANAIRHD